MQSGRTSEQIKAEIERLFGFFPNFFQPVLDAPETLESLWQQALTGYVNNPLPALFKEKLFARLSRYCATPYCLVTHSCLMRFLGQSAGEIARVLESPTPATDAEIEKPLQALAAEAAPLLVWPEPGSQLERALLCCAEISFLNTRGAAACRAALRRLLGTVNHAHLIRFLSFVKLAHLWIESYPEVSYEADERTMELLATLVEDEPRLADFFSHYPEIVRRERESREERLSAELADLKQIEEALRVSEERYRTLVESAPEAILVVDVDTGRFVDANENSVRLFGLEREELLKLGPVDVSPFTINGHDVRELAAEKIQETLNGGAAVFEWIHRNSAGEDIPCEVRLMRLPGTRNLVRGSITDITERKLAEKAGAKQLAAMEAVPDGIAILNHDEVYTYMNEAHAKTYGYDRPEELIGKSWRLLYFEDEIKRIEQEVWPELGEKGRWQGELPGKRRDGSAFDVEVSLTALQDDELICVCRDVTERKCADEALRQSVERLRIMREIDRSILAAQSAEEIARVALRRLRELVPAERITVALKGPAPDEATVLATDEDAERDLAAGKRLPLEPYGNLAHRISETLQRGETYLLDVLNAPDSVPAVRDMQTTGRRYYFIVPLLADGELIGSLSLGTNRLSDLTAKHLEVARGVADGLAIAVQQARLHEQIEQHAAELEQRVAERTAELEAFSYSVSHDLRTPLLTIDGFSRMLLEDYSGGLDAEGQRLLKTICSNSQNMGRLIDDLLAFSRLGRQEMRPAEIEMSELARTVCTELQATAPERKLQFRLQPLPPAHGDPAMIRQVFVNLISNAIKFTGPRDVAMIEVGAVEEENHNVYFVKDNGVGFEMKYADKLFGVFQRLHRDDEFAGTGVGLAFVQRIIQRHGGRVWAEGKAGAGATVYFTLPRRGRKSW
ncbi:MAG: PAS domain S-box protein [Verrucomicrobiales bacterium]|nr:PAS domain S-box protein [Verrucomicrobiales bacterium]